MSARVRKSLRRRHFMQCSAGAAAADLIDWVPVQATADRTSDDGAEPSGPITLFLCGDAMLGRGIDQILPHPGDPHLYEPAMLTICLGTTSLPAPMACIRAIAPLLESGLLRPPETAHPMSAPGENSSHSAMVGSLYYVPSTMNEILRLVLC